MPTKTLIAFHGDEKIKDKYFARVEAHRAADEIIKGAYGEGDWNNGGKGCAVGCTIHSSSHDSYETELGIPRILARLEDEIFEGSSNEWAVKWPGRFLEAIPVGADLSHVWPQFAVWLLVDEKDGVVNYAKSEKSIAVIRAVAHAYKRGETDKNEWLKLRVASYAPSASDYAASYAASASYAPSASDYAASYAAAASHAAASYTAAASYAASYAASHAAASYAYAASHAADTWAAASHAASHAADARTKAYERQGEKLLELLRAAPFSVAI